MSTQTTDLFLAFADGALAYDCAPCGRCCHGFGFAFTPSQLDGRPEPTTLAAFVAGPVGPAGKAEASPPLLNYFTFADGCRFLRQPDHRCSLHAAEGPKAKPAICRLFPLSRLVSLDGLLTLLPATSCPWVAAPVGAASELSAHAAVLEELSPLLAAGVTPLRLDAVTPLPVDARRALETELRQVFVDAAGLADAQVAARRSTSALLGVAAPEAPFDLWLDLLRCAGEPPPLVAASERLVQVAAPGLRLELAQHLPLHLVPLGLDALVLHLRALAELGRPIVAADDLYGLLPTATPLIRLLVAASLPKDEVLSTQEQLGELREGLAGAPGDLVGEALLFALRGIDRGALELSIDIGRAWRF